LFIVIELTRNLLVQRVYHPQNPIFEYEVPQNFQCIARPLYYLHGTLEAQYQGPWQMLTAHHLSPDGPTNPMFKGPLLQLNVHVYFKDNRDPFHSPYILYIYGYPKLNNEEIFNIIIRSLEVKGERHVDTNDL
jgi:hypothetical protein